jgi:hypothetical protein
MYVFESRLIELAVPEAVTAPLAVRESSSLRRTNSVVSSTLSSSVLIPLLKSTATS